MELFWKAIASALMAAILGVISGKINKENAVMIAISGCLVIAALLGGYLRDILDFLKELETLGNLRGEMLGILINCAGVGLVSELSAMICTDSGFASLGKMIQTMGVVVVLWLSIPAFRTLLNLMNTILGEI